MEVKITVNLGATLQIENVKTGEWDYIKPTVGVEATLKNDDFVGGNVTMTTQDWFNELWDEVLAPQFKKVIDSLLEEDEPEETEHQP